MKLTSKGDLSYFYKYQDEKAGKKGKPAARKKPVPAKPTYGGSKAAETQNTKSLAGDKTVKQLLGELYEDREYLEKLLVDSREFTNNKNIFFNSLLCLKDLCFYSIALFKILHPSRVRCHKANRQYHQKLGLKWNQLLRL